MSDEKTTPELIHSAAKTEFMEKRLSVSVARYLFAYGKITDRKPELGNRIIRQKTNRYIAVFMYLHRQSREQHKNIRQCFKGIVLFFSGVGRNAWLFI